MTFKISLSKAANKAAQLGSNAKGEEDGKQQNKPAKMTAGGFDELGEKKNVFGEAEDEYEEPEDEYYVPTNSKRHFSGRPRSTKSGPGTLDHESLSFPRLGAPGGFSAPSHNRPGRSVEGTADVGKSSENVYTKVVARVSNMPPDMTHARVEELFSEFPALKVVKVENAPLSRPNSPSQIDHPTVSMTVTFDKNATARNLDDAMNKMNDKKYLGCGYYLHLDRYLGGRALSTKVRKEPFGATWQPIEHPKGVAPPPNLGGNNRDPYRDEAAGKELVVTVSRPPDLPTLRLIHMTIEKVIEGGVEFEECLMNDPIVQTQERFAWLYDTTHPLSRYYRYRLYQIVTGDTNPNPEIFEGQPKWRGPKDPLPDEFVWNLWDLKDPSDSEDEEDEPQYGISTVPACDDYPGRVTTGYGIMPPRSKAFLIWLLASLPPTPIIYGDVAAFSEFAIRHSTRGVDEIVEFLVTNLFVPFALTPANHNFKEETPFGDEGPFSGRHNGQLPTITINALKIINDVAFTTYREKGAAYKYRSVIASSLMDRGVFRFLETLPVKWEMGRLAAKNFREEVNFILKVWTNEGLFEKHILEQFDREFNSRTREKEQEEAERRAIEKRKAKKGSVPTHAKYIEYMDEDTVEDAEQDEGTPMDVDPETEAPAENVPSSSTGAALAEASKNADAPQVPDETAAANPPKVKRVRKYPPYTNMFASDDDD